MAEALDLNIPLVEGGAESVEKIIKPLLDLEKTKSGETEKNSYSIEKEFFSVSSVLFFSRSRRGLMIFSTDSAPPSPRGILRSKASAIIYILFGMWSVKLVRAISINEKTDK